MRETLSINAWLIVRGSKPTFELFTEEGTPPWNPNKQPPRESVLTQTPMTFGNMRQNGVRSSPRDMNPSFASIRRLKARNPKLTSEGADNWLPKCGQARAFCCRLYCPVASQMCSKGFQLNDTSRQFALMPRTVAIGVTADIGRNWRGMARSRMSHMRHGEFLANIGVTTVIVVKAESWQNDARFCLFGRKL